MDKSMEFGNDSSQPIKKEEVDSGLNRGADEVKLLERKGEALGAGTGQDTGNLLGDLSFTTTVINSPMTNESKTVTNSAAGGDTQILPGVDLPFDFDCVKDLSTSTARLDQVSPPRSPFVELDKGALNDDHFSVVEDQKMVPSAPAASTLGILGGKDEFAIEAQPHSSELEIRMIEKEHKEDVYEIGASFSKNGAFRKTEEFENNSETHRFSSPFEMVSSLDDIQPPEFYESGDSEISREIVGGNKSATDSQVLEPDDLDEYLPKDPTVDSVSTTSTLPGTPSEFPDMKPHTADTNILEVEALGEFTSESVVMSSELKTNTKGSSFDYEINTSTPFEPKPVNDTHFASEISKVFTNDSKSGNFEMFEDQTEEADDAKTSVYNFYTKEPVFIPEDGSPSDDSLQQSPRTEAMFFDQVGFTAKTEPELSFPPTVDKVDVDHVRHFEAQHAELSTFLQERDPTSTLDEFDRSEDSISPNPQIQPKPFPVDATKPVEDYGFDYDHEFEPVSNEPIIEAVKIGSTESRAFPKLTTPFEHVEFQEKESPESVDEYEFEVIPPKVPPHRYPLEETVKKEADPIDFSVPAKGPEIPERGLYQVNEPIGLSPTPPPSATDLEKKAAEAKARKEAEEEELIPFLPKESFETIPSVYTAPPEISPKVIAQKGTTEVKSSTLPKVTPKISSGKVLPITEEAQQILNIFNPKAWFDPNKLHPTVSELVYWRDPKKSGVVFGSIFLVLIALTCLSFISVVAYTSLAVLSGTFAFRIYKNVISTIQKTDEGHPFKEYLEQDLALENDKIQEVCRAVIAHANKLAIQLRHLFLVEDLVDSAKFGGLLYFLTYLGAWFNGLTIVILAFLALFGLPKVYELNKRVIDQYMDLACAKLSEISAKVHEALPFGKKEKAQ